MRSKILTIKHVVRSFTSTSKEDLNSKTKIVASSYRYTDMPPYINERDLYSPVSKVIAGP